MNHPDVHLNQAGMAIIESAAQEIFQHVDRLDQLSPTTIVADILWFHDISEWFAIASASIPNSQAWRMAKEAIDLIRQGTE